MILEFPTTNLIVIMVLIPRNPEVRKKTLNILGSIQRIKLYFSIQRSLIHFPKKVNNKKTFS